MTISYDSYLNRIQKLAKVKKFVHKFRFLFIGLFALIIAATTGLLVAKGSVTTAMSLLNKDPIYFGDEYSFSQAKAFLSSVKYEFSLEGSGEWSNEKPVKAGKYLARTVTKKAVGNGYSSPISFEILPLSAQFTIGADSVVYGNVPDKCSVSDLKPGLKLVTSELKFTYESYVAEKTQVDVVPESVKITDATGDDFTCCYDITYSGKELNILKRSITLQPENVKYDYSDKEISIANDVSAHSKSQLAFNDTITVENFITDRDGGVISMPKYSGDYYIGVKSYKIMHGTDDVTHQYDAAKIAATLTISSRDITITTKDETKVYDGKALKNENSTASGLVEGHRISARFEYPSLTDAGSILNENYFDILDGNGNRVTDNYNIIYKYGMLEVTKRPITVKTGDATREYDGSELYNYAFDVTSGSVADGQTSYLSGNYGIYNVWENGKNLLSVGILDGRGTDVSYNYQITYVYGTLTLTPRAITIETLDGYKVYDGEPLFVTELKNNGRLVSGHRVEGLNTVFRINAGEQPNNIQFAIYDIYGGSVTENYKITPVYGKLTIDKRPITVKTSSKLFVFDGEYHTYDGYATSYYNGNYPDGLVKNDKLSISNLTQIRNVGTAQNKFDIVDLSGNYDIKGITYGTLEVTPRYIVVVTATDQRVYNGTPFSNPSISRTYLKDNENAFGLVPGDEDKLVLSGEPAAIVNVGSIRNECAYVVTNNNYVIDEVKAGWLTVTPRPIEVQLLDVTVVYGNEIKYPSGKGNIKNLLTCNLVANQSIEVFVNFYGVDLYGLNDVGSYTISYARAEITDKNGEITTSNYNVSPVNSTLSITPRPITIKTTGNTKVYDGEPLYNAGEEAPELLSAHRANVVTPFGVINVDDSDYDRTVYGIVDRATNRDVTHNYSIAYDYGYLEVTARPITVKTASDEKVYDGTPLENPDYTTYYYNEEGKEGLLNGDKLTLVGAPARITNVGNGEGIDNACAYNVPNSNYKIEQYVYGKLKITPRWIIVSTGTDEKVYDKTPLTCGDYKTEYYLSQGDENGNTKGLIGNDTLTLKGELASIINVGSIPNDNSYTASSNYYIYGRKLGSLTINVRKIVVVTGSDDKVYDGTPLTCTTYTTYYYANSIETGLIEGDGELTLVGAPASITNVGSVPNANEYQVPSNNYEIEKYDYGTLEVTPAPLDIVISSLESVDYGDSLVYPMHKGNYESATGLVNGEEAQIYVIFTQNGQEIAPKNAGSYYMELSAVTIYDRYGNEIENGSGNYDISCDSRVAKILPKSVKVIFTGATEVTYGRDYVTKYEFDLEELPYGEEIELGFIYCKQGDSAVWNTPKHVGIYEIVLHTATVYSDGEVVEGGESNYDLWHSASNSLVEVTPLPITVQLLDIIDHEYGEEYKYPVTPGNYAGQHNLPYGDTITVFAQPMPNNLDAGNTYTTYIDEARTLVIREDAPDGVEDTSDYEIEYLSGKLKVIARKIVVTNIGAKKIYDGAPLTNSEYRTSHYRDGKAGLLFGAELELAGELVSITDVGTKANANRYNIGSNYEIMEDYYVDQPLEVTERTIYIVSGSEQWEYDGEYHDFLTWDEEKSYYINEKGEKERALVLDHEFIVGAASKIKDVGTISNFFESFEIRNGDGEDVTNNYIVDNSNVGTLEITPRPIIINTNPATKPYDGTMLFDKGFTSRHAYIEGEPGLVAGDEFEVYSYLAVTDVWEGEIDNIQWYNIPKGEYGNENYEIIEKIYGKLKVTALQITVVIEDISEEYDCGPHYFVEGEVAAYTLVAGETLQIEVDYMDAFGAIIPKPYKNFRFDVGTYGIVLDKLNSIIYKNGEVKYRGIENYDISCDTAKFNVEKRNVNITIKDIVTTYGDEIVFNGYKGGEDIPYFWGVQEQLTFRHYFATLEGEAVEGRIRAGRYLILADEDSVRVDGKLPSNYNFHFIPGELYISQRDVTVTLKSLTATYGEQFEYPAGAGNYQSAVTLAYDDTLEVFVNILAGEKPEVGDYDIVIDQSKCPFINGAEDISDYNFKYYNGTFTVNKAPLTVVLNHIGDKYYGGTLTHIYENTTYLSAEGLVYDEELIVEVYYTDASGSRVEIPKNTGEYTVWFDGERSSVTRSVKGLGNYDVSCENKTAKIHQHTLSIELTRVEEFSHVFDGTAHEYFGDGFTLLHTNRTQYGEVLTVYVNYYKDGVLLSGAPVDAGDYTIKLDKSRYNIDGVLDVYSNYNLSSDSEYEYKITPATLTVTLEYAEYNYGSQFDYAMSEHFLIDGLCGGDSFSRTVDFLVDGEIVDPRDVGVYTVRFDSKAVEFTSGKASNYVFAEEFSYGSVKIFERYLNIAPIADTIIYGEEFSYSTKAGNYDGVHELPNGEQLKIFVYLDTEMAIPDVGVYNIVISSFIILDRNGEPIEGGEANYDVTFSVAKLTILVRTIVIESEGFVWTYDGKEHDLPGNGDDDCFYITAEGNKVQPALVQGHSFIEVGYPKIKEVGSVINTCYDTTTVLDGEGNPVKEGNYKFDLENSGKLTINLRKIEVTTGSDQKEYDGETLSKKSIDITFGSIAENQRYELSDFSITNVRESRPKNNVLEITIYDENGEVVNDNYDIEYVYGTLTVTRRLIVVVTAPGKWVYDGATHSKTDEYSTYHFDNVNEIGLIGDDKLSIVNAPTTIKDVGSKLNYCTFDGGSNYKIERVDPGLLVVTERHITVKTGGDRRAYNREPLYCTDYNTYLTSDPSLPGLVGGDTLTLDESSIVYITEVGKVSNTLRFTCESKNYIIDEEYVYGELEVTKRALLIETNPGTKVYDGEPLFSEGYTVSLYVYGETQAGLLEGDELIRLSDFPSIIEVGEIENVCKFAVPDEDHYYIAAIRYGKLVVTPAPLKVVLCPVDDVDYGETFYYPEGEGNYISAEGLVGDEKLTIVVCYMLNGEETEAKNAGDYLICVDLKNSIVTGTENGIGNYDVDYTAVPATINKLNLTIALSKVEDLNHSYDGEAHEYDPSGYTIVDGHMAYGENLIIAVKYFDENGELLDGAPVEFGTYYVEVDIENCMVDNGLNANVNYIIECGERYEYTITLSKFTVYLEDFEYVYNGEEFNYSENGFTVEGLLGDDEIECNVKYYLDGEEVGAPKDAGVYEVVFDTDNIVFVVGRAANYTFDGSAGRFTATLTIYARQISVTVQDREIEYTEEVNPADESYLAEIVYGKVLPDSDEAFVGDDEANAGVVFYYFENSSNVPSGVGEYEIYVKFTGEVISKNYIIEDITPGKLTITGRKVLITPVYTGGDIEYNGEEVDIQQLIDDGLLGFTHIHALDGVAADDLFGFFEEDLEGIYVSFLFNGENYVKNADTYKITVNISGSGIDNFENKYKIIFNDSVDVYLKVTRKTIEVTSLTIPCTEKVYDKQAVEAVQIEYRGLAAADEAICSVIVTYGTGYVPPVNAGTYYIGAAVSDFSLAGNYNIVYLCETGKITITPVTLFIRPKDKSELYNGQNIEILADEYEFVDRDGGKFSGLVEGDEIRVKASASLDPSKTRVSVTIASYEVRDVNTNERVTGNYLIYCAYNKSVMGAKYSSNDFKATLEYQFRTIEYMQIVPEGQSTFPYDGNTHTVTATGGNLLYRIVGGHGLAAGDHIEVSSTIGPYVGDYTMWLDLRIYRGTRNVTKLYNLVLTNGAQSVVSISALPVSLKLNSLTSSMLESGEAFYTTSQFDNRYALKTDYYTVEGIEGHEYEVVAIKSNGVWNFALVVYEVKASGSLSDKSDCYKLTEIQYNGLSVICTIIDYHLLTDIKSDIVFTLNESYSNILSGAGFTEYNGRPALNSYQYTVEGLLEGHVSEVVVVTSGGKLTLAILVTNGKSDRSYYYNLYTVNLPADCQGNVNAVLVSDLSQAKQDVTITFKNLPDILNGEGLETTFDGYLAISDTLYTVEGLIEGHTVQILVMMEDGNVTFAVLIFEAKYKNGVMSDRSSKYDLYNLICQNAPGYATVKLIYEPEDILIYVAITLGDMVTAENLAKGIGVETVDGKLVLAEGMFTVENNFGHSPLADGYEVVITVEAVGDGTFNLNIKVYLNSITGKRDRTYLYTFNCHSSDANINVIY